MKKLTLKLCLACTVMIMTLSLALTGCFSSNPTTQEIIDKSLKAGNELKTFQCDMTMSMKMNATGDKPSDNGSMTMSMNGNGTFDEAQKQMYMKMTMDMETDMNQAAGMSENPFAAGADQGKMTIPVEYYLKGDYTYMKMGIPFIGSQWMKTKAETKSTDSQFQAIELAKYLKDAIEVVQTGTETVNGTECYVMQVKPDMNKIMEGLKSLAKDSANSMSNPFTDSMTDPTTGSDVNIGETMDPSQIDFNKFIKKLDIKEWIAKGSYQVAKAEINALISFSEADMGQAMMGTAGMEPTATGSGQMTIELKMTINCSDFNKPVTITLPPEAESAQEMPSASDFPSSFDEDSPSPWEENSEAQ